MASQAQAAADDVADAMPAKTKKPVPPKAAKKPKIAAASTPADAAQPPKAGGISAFSVFSQEYRTQLKSMLAASSMSCSICTAATDLCLELITRRLAKYSSIKASLILHVLQLRHQI